MELELRAINDGFGRQVVGIDLWTEIDDPTIDRIQVALSTIGVLVFRRQSLSEDELVAFSARFGQLEVIVRTDWESNIRPEVTHLSNLKDSQGRQIGRPGTGELEWHSDQSYRADPATGTFLYSVEVPTEGGNTYFANLHLAYEQLPQSLKNTIKARRGVFSYARRVAGYEEEKELEPEMKLKTPDISHALVQKHPVNGRESLYFDPSTVIGIEGLPDEEAEAILKEINAHATNPQFTYCHEWQAGDLVMWDNGFTMHRRDSYDAEQRRFLKRTSVRLPPDIHIVPN